MQKSCCFCEHLLLVGLFLTSRLLLQKKVVEQLRKELLVKQEPEAKLQLHVQTPPVGGDIKPANLLQSQQIPGGLQQVGHTHTHLLSFNVNSILRCSDLFE